MNLTQTLKTEIASLVSGNDLYNSYQGRWEYLLESYIGGDEYRKAGHLTRYQLESDAEYEARLRETPLENHCASVISVYNSFLFRTQPTREYGSITNLPELEDFLQDADFDGRSLNAFMKDAETWASVFGHAWIILAQPDVGAMNKAEQLTMGVRPYASVLTPLVVLDWRWSRNRSGRYTLEYMKYLEDVNGDIRTVKEWYKDTIVTTVVDLEANEVTEIYEEPNQLGVIPAVCMYNKRSTVRGIGVSDITDIADVQRYIYNATSECAQSIRLDSHPSLVKTEETNAGIGAGSLIHMPENLDPGLKPYLLEFNGASVQSIHQSIAHAIESIDKMANTGAIRSTEARRMSGVAQEQEFQLLNARLSEKADAIELAEEQMWKIWCRYLGYSWDGSIDYPGSFNIRDTGSEIEQLKIAKETATNPNVLREIDNQIISWLGLEPQDMITHDTTTDANRAQHIQEMIMQGLTDQQILDLHPEIVQQDIESAKQLLLNLNNE